MVYYQVIRATALAFLLFSLFLGVSLAEAQEQTQADNKRYYIYGDRMPGTKFREKIFSSSIPLNKPYSELSEKQQAYIRSDYEGMPASETPPFPKKGYGAIIEPLVKAHSIVLKNGRVIAIATIDTNGAVKQVELLSTPNEKLGEFVISLLFNTTFDAGTCSGKPCAMEYLLELDLRVKAGNF